MSADGDNFNYFNSLTPFLPGFAPEETVFCLRSSRFYSGSVW